MKIKMVISYDGSKFKGFQRQNNVRNIQGELEKVLSNIYNEEILIKGAGRTDRGVHAKGQVIHFETDKKIKNLKYKLNKCLKDIHIKKVKRVNDNFHSRFDVKEKVYLYKIDLSGKRNNDYYLNISYYLDLDKMKRASKLFLGTNDFCNFTAGYRDDYTSTIKKIKIWQFNKIIYLKFQGYGFYRYMVRNLVGALIEVGKGKVNAETIKMMLKRETEKRLPTVSPNGLYLVKVKY